jgi:hypothetical protein
LVCGGWERFAEIGGLTGKQGEAGKAGRGSEGFELASFELEAERRTNVNYQLTTAS